MFSRISNRCVGFLRASRTFHSSSHWMKYVMLGGLIAIPSSLVLNDDGDAYQTGQAVGEGLKGEIVDFVDLIIHLG